MQGKEGEEVRLWSLHLHGTRGEMHLASELSPVEGDTRCRSCLRKASEAREEKAMRNVKFGFPALLFCLPECVLFI